MPGRSGASHGDPWVPTLRRLYILAGVAPAASSGARVWSYVMAAAYLAFSVISMVETITATYASSKAVAGLASLSSWWVLQSYNGGAGPQQARRVAPEPVIAPGPLKPHQHRMPSARGQVLIGCGLAAAFAALGYFDGVDVDDMGLNWGLHVLFALGDQMCRFPVVLWLLRLAFGFDCIGVVARRLSSDAVPPPLARPRGIGLLDHELATLDAALAPRNTRLALAVYGDAGFFRADTGAESAAGGARRPSAAIAMTPTGTGAEIADGDAAAASRQLRQPLISAAAPAPADDARAEGMMRYRGSVPHTDDVTAVRSAASAAQDTEARQLERVLDGALSLRDDMNTRRPTAVQLGIGCAAASILMRIIVALPDAISIARSGTPPFNGSRFSGPSTSERAPYSVGAWVMLGAAAGSIALNVMFLCYFMYHAAAVATHMSRLARVLSYRASLQLPADAPVAARLRAVVFHLSALDAKGSLGIKVLGFSMTTGGVTRSLSVLATTVWSLGFLLLRINGH